MDEHKTLLSAHHEHGSCFTTRLPSFPFIGGISIDTNSHESATEYHFYIC